MSDLLRQYSDWECGWEGYPFAWAHETLGEAPREGAPVQDYPRIPAIKDLIREQAGHRCQRCGHPYRKGEHGSGEWSPCDEQCTHLGPARVAGIATSLVVPAGELVDGDQHSLSVEAQWRILTVHHLDGDKGNCRWWNLVALDQRCHLRMQRAVVMDRVYSFEHSEWFKPYAAAFYAWKYLGEDLGREETLSRLPQLLALEHRFTQEAIF